MISRIVHERLPEILDLVRGTSEICTLDHVGEHLKGDRGQDDDNRHGHKQLQQGKACRLSVAPLIHGFSVVEAPLGRRQDYTVITGGDLKLLHKI